MSREPLKLSLFLMRATLGIFFAVWAIEKFVKPETTAAIWKAFYFVDGLPAGASYLIGACQLLFVALFVLGLFKTWSYGFFLLIHGLGTVTTYDQLLHPYTGSNHLFVAAIPLVGMLAALFLMRQEDTMLTVAAGRA